MDRLCCCALKSALPRVGGRGNENKDTHDRAPSASGHPARLTARRLDVSHTKLRSHLDHASSRTALLNPISPINLLGGSWYPSAASSAVRRPPWAMIALPPISVGGRSTSPGDVAYAYVMLTLTRHTTYGACRACGAPDSAGEAVRRGVCGAREVERAQR